MDQNNKKDSASTEPMTENSKNIVTQQNHSVKTFTQEQINLIKRTVAKGATDDELKLFMVVANKAGLDPFTRQIHFVKRGETGTFQVGIDGFRTIAERTGVYAGNDDPIFDKELNPTKATVTVYKIVQGVRCPFTATARWSQYYPGDKQGFMWKKMPHLMLGKCAEALALRKAFPNDLSGFYTDEEMAQADSKVVEAKEVTVKQQKPTPVKAEVVETIGEKAKDYLSRLELATTKEEVSEVGNLINASKKAGELSGYDWEQIKPKYMAKLEGLTK